MISRGKEYKIANVIIILLCILLPVADAQAKEPSLPHHLIRTVSDQDIYEGLAALKLLQCPVLEKEDMEAARENVENCVVRVIMGRAYGSGVIYAMTADAVIIATNRHVLEYWDDAEGIVWFPQGYFMSARCLGSAENCDVGFLRIESSEFAGDTLPALRHVAVDEESSAGPERGTAIFCLGAGREVEEVLYQEAVVEEPVRYIGDFDAYMLYGRGFAREGMSGCGIFDGCGYLVGLLAGGTDRNEIAGVPAKDVAAAYREIVGE